MPAARESHAATRRNGDLRPILVSPASGYPPQSNLRARFHRRESSARNERRRDATPREMAALARYAGDGDLPSFVSAAPLQSKREERSLGGSEKGPALCLRLAAASS